MTSAPPLFAFDNSYARDMEGFYVAWQGETAPAPRLIMLNRALARDLGLDPIALDSEAGAAIFAGSVAPDGANPLAQAYAGHQFGGFSPQLGDGRALLIGEVLDSNGSRFDIHLKGSGRTPFSRGGDGKAVLGPVLREYLMGEAMHALGVPTTRALAAVATGETIRRDGAKPGAVLTRIASSHLRVGTFQFFAARGEWDQVRKLADYAIARHDPDLSGTPQPYLAFFERVVNRQAALIAKWLNIGFIHGVMNTDNMTISGETIDYGPCAFMDTYDPDTVFSSIDRNGRYAFGNQPAIARWNLARLAETLLQLIDPDDNDNAVRLATHQINRFVGEYTRLWQAGMRAKLGLTSEEDSDADLINDLFTTMEGQDVDFTLLFRSLARAAAGDHAPVRSLFNDPEAPVTWLARWTDRLSRDPQDAATRAEGMNRVNPIYIPRNHLVEAALNAAEQDDNLGPFERLLEVLSNPFEERAGLGAYAEPAPKDFGPYQTFCGT